jgi:hypothetical protein
MTQSLIWLHEEALTFNHPAFKVAPQDTKAIFVWDDKYFENLNYSLKRLVFIYETLCALPVDIIRGDTVSVITALAPSRLYVPSSNKPHIILMIEQLKLITAVDIIKEIEFAKIDDRADLKRFFKYWSLAEKTACLKNGGIDA